MKKRLFRASVILLAVIGVVALLLIVSHRKAIRVEHEVLKSCLASTRNYDRMERFGAFDPWTSVLPHWTITYNEDPTDVGYKSPSITVDIFGRVVDWRSKEVAALLVEKGYKDSD